MPVVLAAPLRRYADFATLEAPPCRHISLALFLFSAIRYFRRSLLCYHFFADAAAATCYATPCAADTCRYRMRHGIGYATPPFSPRAAAAAVALCCQHCIRRDIAAAMLSLFFAYAPLDFAIFTLRRLMLKATVSSPFFVDFRYAIHGNNRAARCHAADRLAILR